jgi:hypothetical protein
VNVPELSMMLKANRPWFLANPGGKDQPSEPPTGRWLDEFLEVLTLFDSLHVEQLSAPGQAAWRFRLKAKE